MDIAWQGSLFEEADPERDRLSFDGLRHAALDDRSWLDVGTATTPSPGTPTRCARR
jgi:hypothetical protein